MSAILGRDMGGGITILASLSGRLLMLRDFNRWLLVMGESWRDRFSRQSPISSVKSKGHHSIWLLYFRRYALRIVSLRRCKHLAHGWPSRHAAVCLRPSAPYPAEKCWMVIEFRRLSQRKSTAVRYDADIIRKMRHTTRYFAEIEK